MGDGRKRSIVSRGTWLDLDKDNNYRNYYPGFILFRAIKDNTKFGFIFQDVGLESVTMETIGIYYYPKSAVEFFCTKTNTKTQIYHFQGLSPCSLYKNTI